MRKSGYYISITNLDDDEIHFAETLANEIEDGCTSPEEAERAFAARVREIRARRRVFGDDRGNQ